MTPAKLAERATKSQKKLNDIAISIVDEWERDGEIKGLYRDFKATLDAARDGKVSLSLLPNPHPPTLDHALTHILSCTERH
jgi:hypothetical protein